MLSIAMRNLAHHPRCGNPFQGIRKGVSAEAEQESTGNAASGEQAMANEPSAGCGIKRDITRSEGFRRDGLKRHHCSVGNERGHAPALNPYPDRAPFPQEVGNTL